MKKLFLYISVFLCLSNSVATAQKWVQMMNDPNTNFFETQKEFYNYFKGRASVKGSGYKQFKRWEYLMQSRIDKNGNVLSSSYLQQQLSDYKARQAGLRSTTAANWTVIGPNSAVGLEDGIGRVQCFTRDPANTNIYWAGTPGGGLWKSIDAGANWVPKTDNLISLGISCILIHPTNTSIMYISTGDPESGAYSTHSKGVLKSTDGGNTWVSVGLTTLTQINKLCFFPGNPNTLFAATSDGVYRSTDAGVNWGKVSFTGRIYDIEFHPTTPNTMYAAGHGELLRSIDGGGTWTKLTSGLPTSGFKSLVAVTAQNPDHVFYINTDNVRASGLYKSINKGVSFSPLTTPPVEGHTWWNLVLELSPTNPNHIFTGAVYFSNSTNGGSTWDGFFNSLHADQHNMYFYGSTWFICNDGGLYRSTDNGVTWQLLHNGMAITQFYRMSSYVNNASLIVAGSQDNGTALLKNNAWKRIDYADGMDNAVSNQNPDVIWTSWQGGNLDKSLDGGLTYSWVNGNINEGGGWVTPFLLNPANHDSVIAGFKNVWISKVGGNTWTKISSFNAASNSPNIDKVLTNRKFSNIVITRGDTIWRTTNGGGIWAPILKPAVPDFSLVRAITVDPNNFDRIWVGSATESPNNAGYKIFYTPNGGQSWSNISGTLPNVPILCMEYLPGSNDAIYVGSEFGFFYKDASMSDWQYFNQGLPNVRVEDIDFNIATGKVRVATLGRGIWESPLAPAVPVIPVANFSATPTTVNTGAPVQFTDLSTNTPTTWSWTFTGGTPATSTVKNPSVTYATPGTYTVSLTASNAAGSNTHTKTAYITVTQVTAPVANFSATPTTVAAGAAVQFTDLSTNTPIAWSWTFTGGTPATSTVKNPSVTYATAGTYTVSLTASNAAGSNTHTKTGYITVTAAGTVINMQNATVTSCTGTLYDDGGPSANYTNSKIYTLVIQPAGATSVSINFSQWGLEAGNDFLKIYNGTSVAAPLLGNYSGISPGTVTANSGAMTLRFTSNATLTGIGWKATWTAIGGTCSAPVTPVANFSATPTTVAAGAAVQFTDLSSNTPTAWSWTFTGGTPATSTVKNPSVTYATAGTYSVSLTASNAAGSNTHSKSGYITVTAAGTVINMQNTTVTSCTGTLYDDGGPNANYTHNKIYTLVIQPAGATSVSINFSQWGVEANYDFLKIYNGTTVTAPLLGNYSGTNPGTVTANSGAMTLRFTSDAAVNGIGWKATWTAIGCASPNTSSILSEVQNDEKDLLIYPNPNQGEFTVLLNKPYSQLTITTITGQVIFQKAVTSDKILNLNLRNYPKGIYFIELSGALGINTEKVVIQ